MIVNRIVMTEGNRLTLTLNHTVNGEPFALSVGQKYYIAVSPENDCDNNCFVAFWDSDTLNIPNGLTEGTYIFEIGIYSSLNREVIMPALDENRKPLNQLIVLKRIYNV